MDREELIRFLLSRIDRELYLARNATPGPAREACFHRAEAYRDVLTQFDPEQAERVLSRIVEMHSPRS